MIPKIPAEIRVEASRKNGEKLLIDGEEFPWAITEDGVSTSVGRGIPTVTITLIADRVTIDHTMVE
jgi:hypothetical protein